MSQITVVSIPASKDMKKDMETKITAMIRELENFTTMRVVKIEIDRHGVNEFPQIKIEIRL